MCLCHSNADVERSLSVNKRMLTKQNMSMKDKTIIGLRATKAAEQDNGGVQNVLITLDMIKAVEKSHHLYTELLRHEAAMKSTKEAENAKYEVQKRIFEENEADEIAIDVRLQKLKMEERHMMHWEKQCFTLMKVERKYVMDSKQVI